MRILIVIPSQDRISGNWISACRFQRGLEDQGHQVDLYETTLHPDNALRQNLCNNKPDVALLLHAYRSGKPWQDEAAGLEIPYVVLLTGTDVNQGLDDPEHREPIRSALLHSAAVLLQNPLIAADLSARYPELSTNLHVLAPGIVLGTAPYDLRAAHDLARTVTLFLCPAGLRPVKGLLPLLEMFDTVAAEHPAVALAFCGPQLDADYSRRFLAALETRPWATYLGAIAPQAMANAMRGADVILNNSQSEGLSNVLLEAATIGIPMLASSIPGNAAVVRHNGNGLLYANETEFKRYAVELLDPQRRRQLVDPDTVRYAPGQEASALAATLIEAARSGVER